MAVLDPSSCLSVTYHSHNEIPGFCFSQAIYLIVIIKYTCIGVLVLLSCTLLGYHSSTGAQTLAYNFFCS